MERIGGRVVEMQGVLLFNLKTLLLPTLLRVFTEAHALPDDYTEVRFNIGRVLRRVS